MIYVYLSTEGWDPVSIAIRWFTHSRWSHAGFYDSKTGAALSAMFWGGVKYRRGLPRKHVLLTGPGIVEAYWWAQSQIGKPYDWTAITGIILNRNWRDTRRWYCSELVAAAFEKVRRYLFNTQEPVWGITPRDMTLTLGLSVQGGIFDVQE